MPTVKTVTPNRSRSPVKDDTIELEIRALAKVNMEDSIEICDIP